MPYFTHAAQMFADVAARRGDARALVWSADASTTYSQLDGCSNQVARFLLDRGVGKRDTVAIALEKSVAAYSAIIGCLKIGAAYFVIDPANPAVRTRAMAQTCRPRLAFAAPEVPQDAFECEIVRVDRAGAPGFADGVDDGPVCLPYTIDGSDPAYVMFTSGSTGTPKGVTISQNNLVNFIRWTKDEFDIQPADVFTNVNPLFFDNSVFDIYSSLFTGAALVPFTNETMRSPRDVISRIEQLGCTVYFSVPSLLIYLQTLKLITADSFPRLTKIIFGGEGYPKPMLLKLHDAVGRRIALHNVYGPTECTCICSTYRITEADFADMTGYPPLGALIPNFSYLIMGDDGREASRGEIGELLLGGPCVGLGYYGLPEQTNSVFVQNPTHNRFVDRMYRTGDLVRLDRADGKIHFVGRADTQIKHQGYRIELGEIEHAACAVDGVDEAAAIFGPVREGGPQQIVLVAASGQDVKPAAVKDTLSRRLPGYMIPDKVVVVPALLKNANGKVDRKGIAAAIAEGRL